MYNKPRSRLTLTRETNIHTTNSLASLQIVPTVSSGNSQSSLFSRHTQQFDKSTVQPQDQVIFRPTQILPSDVNMKRYTHQGTPDFALNQFAGSDQKPTEKVPIHYRSNKKQIVPAAALAHDLNAPPDIVQDVEDSGRTSRSSSHLSPNTQKAPAFLPGDRVIFAESPSAPGIPVVYRTPEERSSNPDRLNLDRRKLTVCPILEGEEQLRLLNYQHNMICKIQHLSSLKRLIFLDLYDNQIEEIAGLNALKSLRVLMLGKNRIRRIENLDTLFKLDVLDLHGNQISNIENLNHLTELRVLNLAGNHIVHVDNLSGMDSLAELNLRRNKIKTVVDVDNLPSLQRLFLSFNEISSFEDIACLGESTSLSEISLDGNPIAQEQYYKQIVLRHMQQLKQLDMKRVTDPGTSVSSRRPGLYNPLYHLMSLPGFKSNLASSGSVIPAENILDGSSTDNKNITGNLITPKSSSSHFTPAFQRTHVLSSAGDMSKIGLVDDSDNKGRNSLGKPRFMTVKATNWAVNTTVSSKASSVSNTVVHTTPQRQNFLPNKTGMATKPQTPYTLYRSYTSVEQLNDNSPKPSMKRHTLSLMDPLSTSPMFTLSPVESNDDRVWKFGSEPSVHQTSVSADRPFLEKNLRNGSETSVDQKSVNSSIDSIQNVEKMPRKASRPNSEYSECSESTQSTKTLTETDFINNGSRPISEYSVTSDKTLQPKDGDVPETTGTLSRPLSEYSENSERKMSENVLQGKNVFRYYSDSDLSRTTESKMAQEQNISSLISDSKNLLEKTYDREKQEKFMPFWKVIDNKIVRVTCNEEEFEKMKLDRSTARNMEVNRSTVKPEFNFNGTNGDTKLENILKTSLDAKIEVSNEMANLLNDSGPKSLDKKVQLNQKVEKSEKDIVLEKETTSLSTDKYDISITRNFYQKSYGIDQVTMIIPKSAEAVENPKSNDTVKIPKSAAEETKKSKEFENMHQSLGTQKNKGQRIDTNQEENQASGELHSVKINNLQSSADSRQSQKAPPLKPLKTSESFPNLRTADLGSSGNMNEKTLPELSTKSVRKLKEDQSKHLLVKEPLIAESLAKKPDKLTIFKEPPLQIQSKTTMATIHETENATSQTMSVQGVQQKTGLSKSVSAPSLSAVALSDNTTESTSTSSTSLDLSLGMSSLGSPITLGSTESIPSTPSQPTRKNSGTTMGLSVVKQSFKATPLMLTCSAVFPVVVSPVREEERRIALVMARKDDEKKKDINKTQVLKEKKRLAINNARRQWEVMQGNMINKSGKLSRTPDLYANHVGSIPNAELVSPDGADENMEVESINRCKHWVQCESFTDMYKKRIPGPLMSIFGELERKSRLRQSQSDEDLSQGDNRTATDLSNLADLEGDTLTLYGTQSLEALDRNWGMQAAGAVTHIIFKFIDFEDIAKQLYKVRTKFPGVQTLTFSATNIRSYQQINALSSVRRFDNLIVENEGNPITKFTLWRSYVVFRLAHFALKKINDMEVTAGDIVNAEKLYGPVSHITTSQLPQSRLLSLVGEARYVKV
ncbi:LRRC49 [Mytilus edulis]|uniref:LRRC49 n=1 Tax=Mytilus edulis TaxID=6550 RepID=A0A8S3SJS2_MYTED|nr:LRRC49 [Mytilus edulis]